MTHIGAPLAKAEIVRTWKPELRELGFEYRENMFQFKETMGECLHFAISIQKNLYSDTYLLHHSILIRSPFVKASRQEVLIDGNLRTGGVHLHVLTESWWPPESLPGALDLLKRFAIPWFREWGSATFLTEKVEVAIRERKQLIDVFEPLTQQQEETIARVWSRPVDPNWRVPARTYFYASILHYLAGNREMAITRARDWLAQLGPEEKAEKEQAQGQLAALERIH